MNWENSITTIVKKALSDEPSGHDFGHTIRVKNLALKISKGEHIDKEILVAACLLHDIAFTKRNFYKEHGKAGAELAKKILLKSNFPREKIPAVVHAICFHNWHIYKKKTKLKELSMLRDADRLDALGAIGLARALMFAGANNKKMYNKNSKSLGEQGGVDHVEKRLLKVENEMETKKAKRLAHYKSKILREFVKKFKEEYIK